jgi:uracil-DNA glycosylase family 4
VALQTGVENVTDRASNPFGMQPPTTPPFEPGRAAVFGYGDANADIHIVGDHPGVHGGLKTGVPFTETAASERLQGVFHALGLLAGPYSDEPTAENLFWSYIHPLAPPDGRQPTAEEYAALERYFDAEFRAINAHIIVPVGDRAIRHVFHEYSARPAPTDIPANHASEHTGRGYIIVPVTDPETWTDGDAERLEERLAAILARDYRQTADLGRFLAGDDPYEVR